MVHGRLSGEAVGSGRLKRRLLIGGGEGVFDVSSAVAVQMFMFIPPFFRGCAMFMD